jgi:hypothetical protein
MRSLSVIALVLICHAAIASAAPKVAVLGLEIIDDGSTNPQVVQKTADVAKRITDRLRAEVDRNPQAFRLAPNSRKDLLELKLLSNCSDENAACMAAIGRELGSDFLLYGKLERRPDGYRIKVTWFSVALQKIENTTETQVPFREAEPGLIDPHAARLLKSVARLSSGTTLVIQTKNSSTGTVSLDGKVRGALKNGVLRLSDVKPGNYNLQIEADGFETKAQRIQVRADEELVLDVVLAARETPTGPADMGESGSRRADKIVFWSATVAAVGAGGVFLFSGLKVKDWEDKLNTAAEPLSDPGNPGYNEYQQLRAMMGSRSDDCVIADELSGQDDITAHVQAMRNACDQGKKWSKISWVSGISAGVFALTAGFFGYRAYLRDDEVQSETVTRQPAIQLEPYVGVDGFGAGMTVKF